MDKENLEQLKILTEYLNARTAEYDTGHPTISDKEWDDKYFELICLEKELGYTLNDSPTKAISYKVVNQLEKIEHNHKMLSLEKTKDIDEIIDFVKNKDFLAMAKLDGLTCSLRYVNGRLVSAETRGNGVVGENILHNAKVIASIPKTIPYKDELVVDGEVICTYKDFNDYFSNYKNPRNFASGSIRLLDSKECEKRKLVFVAWEVIKGFDSLATIEEKLKALETFNFLIVPFIKNNIDDIETVKNVSQNLSYPIDGLVFKFNDINYGKSLGETAHHFKNAIAYKFYDETYDTNLLDIEWTMGRTGVLTPVAIFETVDIDGSEVNRASLHNISIMEELFHGNPYTGQNIKVFKSNMIIPQVYSTEEPRNSIYVKDIEEIPFIEYPKVCPICGEPTIVVENDEVRVLTCLNPACEGKLINRLDHFCGKKGLDIKGLSKATLEKLINWGWVNNISDILSLDKYRDYWIKKPGFGVKSVDNILTAIKESISTVSLESFISSLGIPLIGLNVSKELVKYIPTYEEFRQKIDTKFDFSIYEGFAESKTESLLNFDFSEADKIYPFLTFIENKEENNEENCKDIKVVITGKIQYFKNRNELKACIESKGGKVVDSVSKNTTYLINNDINSDSSKNKSAKTLGVPIISEEDFLKKFNLI